ncbi:ribosomal rna large subunit methyltransferase j protein [Cystoisospora suis]|uniref:Cap-specific mRNA (nucleoside-2'-O-)-methyltransferase 1 n=1 Tax=Cystoisospora suis TaxID=483139 RepID=A0A2C6KJZ2_9APIC|nr:ribosomal rna large subunit methyltransferase j protein [Cystoisospora suis]
MPAMAEETELRKVPRDPAEPRDSDAPAASQLAAPSDVNSSNGSRSCASSSDKQRRTEACNKLSESPVSPCFEDIDDSGQHERHTHGQLQSEKQGDSSVPFREHQSGIRTDAQPENGVEVTPPFCREETEGFFSVGGRTTDSANDDGHSSGSCSPCFPVSPSGSSYATRFPSGPHADVRALASCMVISETWTSSDGTGRRQEADRGERVLTAGACVQTALPSSGKEKVEEKALLRRTTSGVRGNIPLSPGYDGLQDARSSNSGGHSFRPQRVFEGRGGKQQPGLTKSQHGEIVPPPREEDIRGMHARRAMMETMLKAEDEKGMAKGKQREELLRRLLMEPKLEMFPVHVDRNLVTSWYYGTPSFSPAQTVEPDPNMPTAEARCKTESTENNACTSDTCSEEKGHSPRPLLTEGKASHGIRERGEGGVSRRPSIGKQLSQTSEEVTDAERYADEPQKSQFKTSESSCGARFGVMPFTRGGRETKAGLRVRASTEAKRFLSGAFCEPDAVEALWSKKTRLDSIFDGEMDWLYRAARDSIFPRDGYSRKHFNRAGDKIEEICDALFFYEGRPHSDDCLLNGDDTCSSNSRPTPNCENTDGSAADPTSSRQGVDEEGSSIVDQRGASYGIRQGGSRSSGKDVEELRGQRRVENHWRRLGILLGEPLTGGVRCVEAQDSISEGDRRREEGKTAWEHGDDEKEDGDERNVTNQHGDRETAIGERRQRFCTNTHRFFVDVCGGPGAWSLFLLAQPSHNVQRGTPTDSASYGSIRPEKSYSSEEGSSAGDTPQNGTEASHVGLGESRGEHRERLRSSSDSRSTQDCSPSEAAAERRREGNILLQGDGTRREGYVVCGFGMTLASGAAEKNGNNDRTIWYPQLLRHPRWNAVWGEDGTGNVYRLKNLSHSKRMISKMISQRLESLAGGEGKCRQGGKKQEVKEKIGQAASDRREEDLETKMNDEGEESSGTPEAANVVRGRSSSSSRSPSDFKREMDDMTGSLSSEQTTEIACGEMEKEFSPIHSASSPVDSDGLSPSGGHQHHNQGVPDGRHSTRNSNLLLKTQCTLSTAASTEGDSIADTSPSKSSLSHLGGPNVPTSSHSGVDDTREEEKENDENCVRTTERKVRREEQMLSCGDGVTSPAGQPGADVNTKQEEEEGDEEYSGVQHVALVVADGGFHLAIDEKTGRHIENFQELLCARLLLSELLFALMLLEERGTFICKIFDTFTHFTASLIYVVGRLFEECFIIKPTGSRAANSERYLVGLRLRSRKSTEFKQLFDVVRGVHAMWERGEQDGGKLAEDESPESLLPVEVLRSDVRFVESLGAACRFLCLKQSLALDMVCRKVRFEKMARQRLCVHS